MLRHPARLQVAQQILPKRDPHPVELPSKVARMRAHHVRVAGQIERARLIHDHRYIRRPRGGFFQLRVVDGAQFTDISPEARIGQPARAAKVHVPARQTPRQHTTEVALMHPARVLQGRHPPVARILGRKKRARIVFVQPEFAVVAHRVYRHHERADSAEAAVFVRDRRAQDVHVRAFQQPCQHQMAARLRAEGQAADLEIVSIKQRDELFPRAGFFHGRGDQFQRLHHGHLQVLIKIDGLLFPCRVAKQACRCGLALINRRHSDGIELRARVAPGHAQRLLRRIFCPQPRRKPALHRRTEAAVQAVPGSGIKPFAGVLRAGMIAEHVLPIARLAMFHQRPQVALQLLPPQRRRHADRLAGAVVILERFIRMRLVPPSRRLAGESRQHERFGIGLQNTLQHRIGLCKIR